MRLVRLVVAGIVLGAVGGYVGALLRPRTVHRNPAAEVPGLDLAPLAEQGGVPAGEVPVTVEVPR